MRLTITDRAAQVTQAGTSPTLVTNEGPDVVYLDPASSVHPLAASLMLRPRQSLTWQGGELWAVAEAGGSAALGVLFGAAGTTIGDVSVDGPVQVSGITNPVNVQGGGEVLLEGTFMLGTPLPGVSYYTLVDIEAPPSGLTYYGLRVTLSALLPSCRYAWRLKPGGMLPGPSLAAGTLYYPPDPLPANMFSFAPFAHRFVTPLTANYPLVLELVAELSSGGNAEVQVIVEGISTAPPGPETVRTFPFDHISGDTGRRFVTAGTVGSFWLPPTFQEYDVRIAPPTGGSVTATSMVEVTSEQAMNSIASNPHMSPYYAAAGATLTGPNQAYVRIRGDGRAQRLDVAAAGANCLLLPML